MSTRLDSFWKRPESRALRFLLTVYFYVVVSVWFIVSFVLLACLNILLLPLLLTIPGLRNKTLGQVHQATMQAVVAALPPLSEVASQKTIVMVNHQSKMDAWVVGSVLLGLPTTFVLKRDLLKVPIAGWAQYLAGCLTVTFTRERGGWGTVRSAIDELMKETLQNLNAGVSVVVFPEGTRSVSGRLQPFKKGFFRLVADNPDIRILPIGTFLSFCQVYAAMHNNANLWPVSSKLLFPGTSYIMAGDYIYPEAGATADELCERTHNAIFHLLSLSPEFDPLNEQPLQRVASTRGHGL